jgi:hypothetical protein
MPARLHLWTRSNPERLRQFRTETPKSALGLAFGLPDWGQVFCRLKSMVVTIVHKN